MINLKEVNQKFLLELLIIIFPIGILFSNILAEFIIFCIILIFFLTKKKEELLSYFNNKIFILLFIFSLFLIINYLFNFNKEPSLTRSLFFLRFPLYVISFSYLLSQTSLDKNKIFFYWGIILLIACLDLQLQNINGKNILGYEAVLQGNFFRLGGFMNDELKIAYFINNFFIITLGYLLINFEKNKNYIFYIGILTPLVIYSVYLTGERANFLTLIIVIFLFFAFSKLKKYFFIILFCLISTLFLFLDKIKESPKFDRMLTKNISSIQYLLSKNKGEGFLYKNNVYFNHYSTALQIFQDYPIHGVGLKNFRNYCDNPKYDKKISPKQQGRKCATHPHNLYFEILSELGSIGFLIFFTFFTYIFYVFFSFYIKSKNIFILGNTLILLTFFIPFLPRGSFFTNWNAIIFWTVFSINCYLINEYKNKKNYGK